MTELEKMQHAKDYIDMLADGINPLNGEKVPWDSTLNNVRLSKCFLYVSDILKQVIENGGEVSRKASSKQPLIPFSLTEEQLANIEITETPVGISVFAKRIAEVVPENTKPLHSPQISNWLVGQGFLIENTYNNKKSKVSTQKGKSLGIVTVEVSYPNSAPYKKNLYNQNAQKYIVENLNKIANDELTKGE